MSPSIASASLGSDRQDGGDSDVPALHLEQLRIGQICAILVRNLTLQPNRDRALRSLADAGSSSEYLSNASADDADLALRIGRSNNKGKARAKAIRRRSSSWGQTNDDAGSGSDEANRRRQLSPSSEPRRSLSSAGRRDSSEDVRLSSHPRRPILKSANSNRDAASFSYFSDLSPSGSSSYPFGDVESNLLSRSDSRGSNKSSSTMTRRPAGRARTISGTSTLSVRSVRFEERDSSPSLIRRPSTPGASRISSASRLFTTDKTLDRIMSERLLDCCVELCSLHLTSPQVQLRDGTSGPAPFYVAESQRGALHHSWGSLRGSPLCPARDFHFGRDAMEFPAGNFDVGLASSHMRIRVWAKLHASSEESTAAAASAWKLVGVRDVDLRDLQRLNGELADPQLNSTPNMMILGISSNSALQDSGEQGSDTSSVNPDANAAEITTKLASKASQGAQQKQSPRDRRLLEQVVYLAVPLTGADPKAKIPQSSSGRSALAVRTIAKAPSNDGFASDPEARSFELRASTNQPAKPKAVLARDRKKAFQAEEKLAIERSLRETRMMPSYTLGDAKKLLDKQLEVGQLAAESARACSRLDDILGSSQGQVNLRLKQGRTTERLRWLQEQRGLERKEAEQRQTELRRRRAALEGRRQRLREATEALEEGRRAAEALAKTNAKLGARLEALSLRVHQRHARLLRSLEDVYPIDLVDGQALLFLIAGIPLPNGVSSCTNAELEAQDKALKALVKAQNKAVEEAGAESSSIHVSSQKMIYHPLDDDTVSTALGLVAQLLTLLSSYLGTPVHYPLATAGSRAVIQDGISIMSGPRAFPLYAKGVERYRYEYAAFLVNKDIEQLMNVHSVTVLDIRHTLPNLKNLIVTVSAAPPASYTTRKRHVGRNEISLISHTTAAAKSLLVNGSAGGEREGKKEGFAQLGLGRPAELSGDVEVATAAAAPTGKNGSAKAEPASLKTTRVLGANTNKAAPTTGDSAIESITKALSFFGSRQT